MNLIYGMLVEVVTENGMRIGRINVGGALRKVALDLLPDSVGGDEVLVCDGVAISRVNKHPQEGDSNVSGHTR